MNASLPPRHATRALPVQQRNVLASFAALCCVLRSLGAVFSTSFGPDWIVGYQTASVALYLILVVAALRGHRALVMVLLGPESLAWAVATILAYGFGASFWLLSIVIAIGITLLLENLSSRLRLLLLIAPLPLAFPIAILVGGADPQIELAPDLLLNLSLANEIGSIAILTLATGIAIREQSRARENAQQLALQRARLIEDLSHEVRTPIATVLMATQGAQALKGASPPMERHLSWIESAARSATRLVERMLELASLERDGSGESDACDRDELVLGDLREAVDQTVSRMRPLARAGGVELRLEQTGVNSKTVDRVSLDIVLHNLISNAISHSDELSGVLVEIQDQGQGVQIAVTDRGEGIAPTDLPFVFDRLWRADRARSRAAGRFGLGLAIAQRHAERLGSKIQVESTLGEGSRFWLVLE